MSKKQITYITPAEAAKRMCISERALTNLRYEKRGPKWVKLKGKIMYDELTVKADLSRQRSASFWENQEPVVLNWRAPAKAPHLDV